MARLAADFQLFWKLITITKRQSQARNSVLPSSRDPCEIVGMKTTTIEPNEKRADGPVAATAQSRPVSAGARIGHVHLKVADLERALRFYRDVLGFEVTQRYGSQAAFLSAGGYHHHIGLNTWESAGGQPPPQGTTGLYHLAILYPTRTDLADAVRRVLNAGIVIEGAADHGVSEAVYLSDPDGNGVELYWDKPEDQWPRTPEGGLAMFTQRLDLNALLGTASAAS
jgi:catechol 2,3-dioxygenase